MEIKKLLKVTANKINQNSPTIYTGIAVTGVISTGLLGIRAGYIARMILEEHDIILDKKEVLRLTWKCYIPVVLSAGITITTILLANHINAQRNDALVSLYQIMENRLFDYQTKVKELLGEKKEEKLRDELTQDILTKNPIEDSQIIITGAGTHLCYDDLSGRYFKSDIESVRRSINEFNYNLLEEMYKNLNEFYDLLGLEPTEMGRNMGWDTDHGMLDVKFTAKLATNGEPCIVLNYPIQPRFL